MTPVAVVSGASRNIGRAIAVEMARAGYRVACLGRDEAMLSGTIEAVEAEGGSASAHTGDVGDPGFAERCVAEVVDAHGGISLVVNNAGILGSQPASSMPVEDFMQVVGVNLGAAFALSRAAYPYLCAAGSAAAGAAAAGAAAAGSTAVGSTAVGSAIVNIGSFFGSLGVPGFAAYASSKAGLEGLTRSLAVEWARDGIRVVCVAPGYVASDMSAEVMADDRAAARILSRIPLRRVSLPAEVAEVVRFLASPAARFITGTTITVDGGQLVAL